MLLQVRAFAPWPGTAHSFVKKSDSGSIEHVPVKILKTRVCKSSEWPDIAESQAAAGESKDECVAIDKKDLYVKCGDGKWLSILKLQIPGKKPIDSVDFINGLQGRTLHLSSPECSDTD